MLLYMARYQEDSVTNNKPTTQLDETIKLLHEALNMADANNQTLVAAHIQMAIDVANQQKVDSNK